jgi:hypothetical protein
MLVNKKLEELTEEEQAIEKMSREEFDQNFPDMKNYSRMVINGRIYGWIPSGSIYSPFWNK